MPKFTVTLMEVAYYDIIVEAENEEDAAVAAEEVFVQAEDANAFFVSTGDREAFNVERMSDEMAAELDDPTNRFPVSDWRYEVVSGDTKLGYDEWLEDKTAQAKYEKCMSA